MAYKVTILFALIFCSGCVATSKHVSKGDRLFVKSCQVLQQQHPGPMTQTLLEEAQEHASQDPSLPVGQGLDLLGMLLAATVPGGAAIKMMIDKARAISLAKEVASMDKDKANQHLINSKVKL